MSWSPRHGHVSQIHPDGSGWDDCWEAALARYGFEAGRFPAGTTDEQAINAVALAARGQPDTPANPDTTLPEAAASLAHYGLPVEWSADYRMALNAPWAICLVDGTKLEPAQYPSSWFGDPGQANHFILWLPNWGGAANWFNDPLAYDNGQQDCPYDLGSVASAFYGAYLLPTTNNGETPPQHWTALRQFGLLPRPVHGSTALAVVPLGGTGMLEQGTYTDSVGETWQRLQWRDRHGWAPRAYVQMGNSA